MNNNVKVITHKKNNANNPINVIFIEYSIITYEE